MIDEELEIKQANFESKYKESEYNEIEKKRKKFIDDFSLERRRSLKKEDYVLGENKNKNTFCYRVENELNDWGNIHGSTAIKFGVYFGKFGKDKKSKYRVGKKIFGNDVEEAYKNVLKSINELLDNKDNIEVLKKNPISPMFKGKILSLYFPDEFLNIFSLQYLKYFLHKLGLNYNSNSELELQKILLDYKNNNEIMKEWNVYKFSKFLYDSLGSPKQKKKLTTKLKNAQFPDFPDINQLKCHSYNLDLQNLISYEEIQKDDKKSKKKDYEKVDKYKKRIGDIGEFIIFELEKKALNELKINKEIVHKSKQDDNAGYDIMSYDEYGKEKFIEVKSTSYSFGNNKIFITANELKASKEIDNYYFYFVFEVLTEPKIFIINSKDFLEKFEKELKPVVYSITLTSNKP